MLSYASFPMTLTLFASTVLSNFVTQNELFLLQFVFAFGLVYYLAVVWVGLMEIHNYSFGTNFKSLLFTGGFMVVAIVALYIAVILFGEVGSFFDSLAWEVRSIVTG